MTVLRVDQKHQGKSKIIVSEAGQEIRTTQNDRHQKLFDLFSLWRFTVFVKLLDFLLSIGNGVVGTVSSNILHKKLRFDQVVGTILLRGGQVSTHLR